MNEINLTGTQNLSGVDTYQRLNVALDLLIEYLLEHHTANSKIENEPYQPDCEQVCRGPTEEPDSEKIQDEKNYSPPEDF